MDSAFDDEEKRAIAGRARTLWERLEEPTDATDRKPPFDRAELRSLWREKLGGREEFERRFSSAEFSAEQCLEAATTARWPDDEPLPEWVDVLDELVAEMRDTSAEARRRAAEAYPERPFTHLFAVLVEVATERAHDDIDDSNVHPDAVDSMASWLHRRFSLRFTRILYVEFKSFVAHHDPELAVAEPDAVEGSPTEYYDQFVKGLLDGDIVDLCLEYPVFARLLARQIRRWHETTREIAERIREDRDALAQSFGRTDELGTVVDLQPLADDTHQDGRAVVRVTFEDGTRAVYKPRSVRTGQVFYSILGRLDDDLSTPAFETPTFVSRDSYGWMEWVEYRECTDERDVRRYYERAGALIAIAYAFEFTDCHFENVVVHGSQPVLVDGETFMHPYVDSGRGESSNHVESFLADSVLLTSMVPWSADASDDSDKRPDLSVMSGIGNGSDSVPISAYRGPQVEAVNTDVMSVSMEHPVVDRSENTPHVDGTEHLPEDYVDAIVGGFSEAYETFRSLHEDGRILGEVVDRDQITDVENRLVYRATQQYMRIVESLCSRDCLRDGARYSLEIEQLAGAFFEDDGYPEEEFPVYEAERTALERLDPPRLTCSLDSDVLSFDGSPLGITAAESGLERTKRRLDSLSDSDRRQQAHVLRSCFGRRDATERATTDRDEPPVEPTTDAEAPTDRTLEAWSADVFDRVIDAAFDPDGGQFSWLWMESGRDESAGQLRLPGTSLGSGRPGIAVTGAALYRRTGAERFRTAAKETMAPLADLASADDVPVEESGAAGVGGLLYGFAVLADLLDDEEMAACAGRVADAIRADAPTDGSHWVADGTAGTLLALVAGYERLGDDEMRKAAVDRGDHLLDQRTRTEDGRRVWTTPAHSEPPIGFAEGVSGVAYALSRLSEISDEPRFAEAADEAMAYVTADGESEERRENASDRSSDDGYWFPDGRGPELLRFGVRPQESDAVDSGVNVESDPSTLRESDALGGGNFARVEFLLEAARHGAGTSAEARELATTCVDRAVKTGQFELRGHSPELVNPTLFGGLAGVSYTLLRATDPDSVPSLLRFE